MESKSPDAGRMSHILLLEIITAMPMGHPMLSVLPKSALNIKLITIVLCLPCNDFIRATSLHSVLANRISHTIQLEANKDVSCI